MRGVDEGQDRRWNIRRVMGGKGAGKEERSEYLRERG